MKLLVRVAIFERVIGSLNSSVQPIQRLLKGLVVTESVGLNVRAPRYLSADAARSYVKLAKPTAHHRIVSGAIKCVAWVLARETGEGGDGYRIPPEILSLLRVRATA